MSPSPPGRRALWLLPIVLIVCALMVLPASAVLSRAPATPATATSGATTAATSGATTAPKASASAAPTISTSLPSNLKPTSPSSFPSASVVTGSSPEDQWLKSLLNERATSKGAPLVSLPNLGILENPSATTTASGVAPFYQSQPAPMGLADFGLGDTGPYAYNTTHINAQILFNSEPGVTAPGTSAVIEPAGGNLGYVSSPFEFSIQLNTVTTDFVIPGSSDGTFWTQNVLDVNTYTTPATIHFVDDVFNLTGPVTAFRMGTIASGCGLTDVSSILTVYGGVYQCVGTTINVPGFPLTISLYNNASVNKTNGDYVTFGYRFSSPTSAFTAVTGVYVNVTFVNPTPTVAPTHPAAFSIDGYSATPSGLLRDAEIILGGPIGGTNAIFSNVSGAMHLYYSNASAGGWKSVPSAYDFGTDTGETSTGVTGYWTAAGTEWINQGPSFLYGLWYANPAVSVSAGDIQYQGTLSPDYGFVFLSNVAPNRYGTNFTILPTNPSGGFDTYLPPLVPPGTEYYVQAFADGYVELNGTAFSTSSTGVALTMALAISPFPLRAPLYMDNDAQAAALGLAVLGDATAPYVYNGLTVYLNLSFNHLNDYSFPSFALFQENNTGVDTYVNNTVQGSDSGSDTLYYYDDSLPAASTGFLSPGPTLNMTNRPDFSLQFNFWNSAFFEITNETLRGGAFYGTPSGTGGSIFLYDTDFAEIGVITSEDADYGSFVAQSAFVYAYNLVATSGSNGLDDVDNFGLFTVYNVTATGAGSFGIYALDTEYSEYEYVNASDGAAGVYAGAWVYIPYYALFGIFDGSIYNVDATSGAAGAVLVDSEFELVEYVHASDGAVGVESNYTYEDAYENIWASGTGVGVFIYGDDHDLVHNLYILGDSSTYASIDELSEYDEFDNVIVNGAETGLFIAGCLADVLEYLWDNTSTSSAATFLEDAGGGAEFITVNATGTVGVNVTDDLEFTGEDAFTNALGPLTFSVTGGALIGLGDGEYASVTGVDASGYWLGIIDLNGDGIFGVELYDWEFATVTNSYAANDNEAVYLDDYTDEVTISGSTAVNDSLAVDIEEYSSFITVTDTTVSDVSTGVFVYESGIITITGVTATNAMPWNPADPTGDDWGPSAAVYTDFAWQVQISDVVATNFAFGLYDYFSGYCSSDECELDVGPGSINVQNLNLTDGYTAVNLDGTYYGMFSGIGAYHDLVGVFMEDGEFNVITQSHFVDNTYYGVALYYSEDNTIWDNTFIGNNGATSTYSAAHIQAFSSPGYPNDWYYEDIGNYWSDWQLDPNGQLYPYVISSDNVDYYPLNVPAGETAVWFFEDGLASGVSWSVTFDGVTQSTSNDWMVFGAVTGSYSFSVGAVAGYTVSPGSGSIGLTAGSTYVDEYLDYTPVYTVMLTETGLAAGTTWSAIVGGVTVSSATPTINVTVPAGDNAYQIPAIAGYTASPSSGTIDVTGPYNLSITFSVAKYAVTVTESGLASGQSWSATVTGVPGATQTSTGTSITFYLPNDTYSIVVANVSGYSLTTGKLSVKVDGAPAGASVSFTANTTTSVVSTDTFNTWLAVLIAIAVIALVIGLLALFLRRGKKEEPPQGAQPWTPPAGSSEGTAGGAPPASGSSGSWSEGPPAGGSPPS